MDRLKRVGSRPVAAPRPRSAAAETRDTEGHGVWTGGYDKETYERHGASAPPGKSISSGGSIRILPTTGILTARVSGGSVPVVNWARPREDGLTHNRALRRR